MDLLRNKPKHEVRRIDFENWPTFKVLEGKILNEFYDHKLDYTTTGFRITFTDKAGDMVTVDSNKNLEIAVREAADGQVLKLVIHAYDRY